MLRVLQSPRFHRSLLIDAMLLVGALAVGTEMLDWSPSISLRAAFAPLCILGNASRYLVHIFTARARTNLAREAGVTLVSIAAIGLTAGTVSRLGAERSAVVFIGICLFAASTRIVSVMVRKIRLPIHLRS